MNKMKNIKDVLRSIAKMKCTMKDSIASKIHPA